MIKLSIQETKENKKNRLLDTGFKLFTEKGIQNTSIQDIVDNANVAKGTFYLYFKDKKLFARCRFMQIEKTV